MAFNITSWSRTGRDFARGEPRRAARFEYVGVGDMWLPTPPAPPRAASAGKAPPARPAAAPAARPAAAPAAPPAPRRPGLSAPAAAALGGLACLGATHLLRRWLFPRPAPAPVAVPDFQPDEEEDE